MNLSIPSPLAKEAFETMSKADRIRAVLSIVDEAEYEAVTTKLESLFGLKYNFGKAHIFSIKAVIKGRVFNFSDGISLPSRLFMILHTLGHYYFISRADKMGIDRYRYIYDTFENTNLHVYEQAEAQAVQVARIVTDKIRRDRTEFEIRANDYSADLLRVIGHPHLIPLIKLYQPADINYILDVTEGGKDAIVPTDLDYLDRYVCNDQSVVEEDNVERIYEAGAFNIAAIDWDLLAKSKLEIHFF
ncbi:hypothetical protein HFN63_36510 [Rhizobium leguminosarum]|uniref:hypothetical protein n=1 Tax=Rhizobium leguminosarum TaxID=384 RepID=UPI001C94A21F|nr:hypothetical protein [Rhizobium leguminosarum]MBY5775429.1 hypothetical protein [Rhizobium leguminosarum]